ncbi:MAG TPA: hypothetical protein VF144_05470 [Chitinophagaceae bacterium]
MEVHHHAHTTRKKLAHYFWEFLMLFLAVFCGFLAEYQLEHKIEKNRERQYIRSFIEDLEADTISLNARIDYCDLTVKRVDSVIAILDDPGFAAMAGEIYYYLRWMHRSDMFSVNDRTIIQLRNAGGMRLVTNRTITDSMASYYREVDYIRFIFEEQTEFRRSLRPYFPKIFNAEDYDKVINERNFVVRTNEPLKLRSADPETFNAVALLMRNIRGLNLGLKRRMENLKNRAKDIREVIIKEYHL